MEKHCEQCHKIFNDKTKFCGSCRTKNSYTPELLEKRRQQQLIKPTLNTNGRPKGSKNKNPYPKSEAILNRNEWYSKEYSHRASQMSEEERKIHFGKYFNSDQETQEKCKKIAIENCMKFQEGKSYHQGQFIPLNPKKYNGDPTKIIYRSSWERRVCFWLDTNVDIIKWSSEEIWIPYSLDGKMRRYFPDFLVTMKTATGIETHIIEVKPEVQIQKPKPPKNKKLSKSYLNAAKTYVVNQKKWEAARAYCKKMNYKFTLLNEYDIGIANR